MGKEHRFCFGEVATWKVVDPLPAVFLHAGEPLLAPATSRSPLTFGPQRIELGSAMLGVLHVKPAHSRVGNARLAAAESALLRRRLWLRDTR